MSEHTEPTKPTVPAPHPLIPASYEYGEKVVMQPLSGQLTDLPPQVTIGDIEYPRRTHFHTTLVSVHRVAAQLMDRRGVTSTAAEELALATVGALLAQTKPLLAQYLPDVRVVTDPGRSRQTIVIRAQVDHLTEFFAALGHQLELDLPLQPSHVTLYAAGDLPIGIWSEAQMDDTSRPLTPAELADWQHTINTQEIFGVTL